MPFVSVPKDLDKVKTKVALNLTKRQLVCFSIAAVIGIPLYFCSKKTIGNETAVLCMVAVMLPFFFIAMYEKDGLPMEKILWNIIRSQILCPRIRPYSTNNLYSVLSKEGIYENKKTNPTRNEITKYKTKTKKNKKRIKKRKKQNKNSSIFSFLDIFRKKSVPTTAQQTIPYQELFSDGICKLENGRYSKTIQFYDINYQLAQNEDKTLIFENYCDFLNYFDSSIQFQLSFLNQSIDISEYQKSIEIPEQQDDFNGIRKEYVAMLKNQLSKGNNGLIKTKYITFSIEAETLKAAKPRLERIETDILSNFKVLGVKAQPLNGKERLHVLHSLFHAQDEQKFIFSWKDIVETGMTTKDFIAPDSFNFQYKNKFQIGKNYGAVSFLHITASELTDRMLADFLDLDSNIVVSIHIQSVDQAVAIKRIKRKLSDINKMKLEEQKKAVRDGYDMDILSPDIVTYGEQAQSLLEDLQNRNERMFLVTVLIMNTAETKQKLSTDLFQAQGIAQKYNCSLRPLDYQQEQALMSSLPLAQNQIEIQRVLTTSSTAIFVPFTTQELFQEGEALYYGLNALSNNLIMADRKRLKNPNGLILGTPGSGKSFSAKREITNAFLLTNDDIAIVDPESEYFPLVSRLGGQVVKISPSSNDYINPMDINLNYSEDDNPLSLKSDFILSLCELIVGGKEGLQPVEKTIIDRCVRMIYQNYMIEPIQSNMPILGDLYNMMREQKEPEAQHLATALEIYVNGSLNIFNHRTNVDIRNRLVCYDIKELGKQLKKIGMLVVQDQVWGRVTENRAAHKSTRLYIDEFHLLLKEEQTAAYSVEIWKRFRKWGGIPTALTQNVKDLLASREIENIFENSDFIYMLNQAQGDRQILAKQLNISPHQLSYVTNTNAGEGLIFYGNVIIPFVDHFPKDTELYSIMSTKLEDLAQQDRKV